jgi:phospholipid N-methyltransferase
VTIISGDAGDIQTYISRDITQAECIISTLPLLSLPESLCHSIMQRVMELLTDDGIFVQAQYTPFRVEIMEQYLDITREQIIFQNVPPAILYVGRKKK